MTNTIRNRVLAFSSLLAATAVLFLTAGEAVTQIRAALVKNTDEPGRLPYQYTVEFGAATPLLCSASTCVVPFPAVPAGKRLVIQHVSILVDGGISGAPTFVAFGDGNPTQLLSGNIAIVQPIFTGSNVLVSPPNPARPFWFLDRQVLVYYEPATTPKIKIQAAAPHIITYATVHGYLIDAVN